jgi:hypothetical protein
MSHDGVREFRQRGQYADTSSNSSGFDNMRARWYDSTSEANNPVGAGHE